MISAVAIDDEPLSLAVIEQFCAKLDGLDLRKTFTEQKKKQFAISTNLK